MDPVLEKMYNVEVTVWDDDSRREIAKRSIGKTDMGGRTEYVGWTSVFCLTLGESQLSSVNVVRVSVSFSTRSEMPQPPLRSGDMEELSRDFERLLQQEASSDVICEVDGEEVPAHKIILSTRLSYFQKLFNAGMSETTTNRVIIKDVDATSFKAVLKFLYSGRLPEDLKTSAKNYLHVAEKYDIRELKEACADALAEIVDKDNAVEVLIMADMFRCATLKTKAMDSFLRFSKYLSDDELKPLKAYPELMFECLKNQRDCQS